MSEETCLRKWMNIMDASGEMGVRGREKWIDVACPILVYSGVWGEVWGVEL